MRALVIFVMINIIMPFGFEGNISLIISMFFCALDAYKFMEIWRTNSRLKRKIKHEEKWKMFFYVLGFIFFIFNLISLIL